MRKYLIFGGLIVLAGIVINYSLGGFKNIEPALISNHGTTIYGLLYEGGHSSDSLNNHVSHFRELLNNASQPGILTIVNYVQPGLEKRGMIKQFIGIEWEHKNAGRLTQTIDSLHIEAYNGFQFRIPVKPLVMPSPEKLKRLADEAAILMDGELQGYSIEQYKERLLIINYPLK